MSLYMSLGIFLAASVIAVPTPPGVPSTDVTAHYGSIYQTSSNGKTTQGFLEIDNSGPADELTRIACPIADTTGLVNANGRPVMNLLIPARQTLILTQNGTHLVLQDLHFSVQYGGIIPCSLTFAVAGTISVFLYATPAR